MCAHRFDALVRLFGALVIHGYEAYLVMELMHVGSPRELNTLFNFYF